MPLLAGSASQPNTRTMNKRTRRTSTTAERKPARQSVCDVVAQHRRACGLVAQFDFPQVRACHDPAQELWEPGRLNQARNRWRVRAGRREYFTDRGRRDGPSESMRDVQVCWGSPCKARIKLDSSRPGHRMLVCRRSLCRVCCLKPVISSG